MEGNNYMKRHQLMHIFAGNSEIKGIVKVISSDPPCKHDKAFKSFVVKRTLLTFNEGSLEIG